jgi:hypothetical protein
MMGADTADAQQLLDALRVVHEALAIPHAATVGDDEVRAKILDQRLGRAVAFLDALFECLEDGRDTMIPWSVGYLRERLAEHPATGYRTWDERTAELEAAQAASEEAHQ